MVKGLYTAYTGMVNEQNRMDIMTNNLANASTVGYKKEGSTSQSFNDVLTVKIKDQSVEHEKCPEDRYQKSRSEDRREVGIPIIREDSALRIIPMIWQLAGDGFLPLNLPIRQERPTPNTLRAGQFTLNKMDIW